MSTKFTPGPWSFSLYFPESTVKKLDNDGSAFVTAEGVGSVCKVIPIDKPKKGKGHVHDDDVRDANAALIAAAPDLYSALEAIIKSQAAILDSLREAAVAALAKARNE